MNVAVLTRSACTIKNRFRVSKMLISVHFSVRPRATCAIFESSYDHEPPRLRYLFIAHCSISATRVEQITWTVKVLKANLQLRLLFGEWSQCAFDALSTGSKMGQWMVSRLRNRTARWPFFSGPNDFIYERPINWRSPIG